MTTQTTKLEDNDILDIVNQIINNASKNVGIQSLHS